MTEPDRSPDADAPAAEAPATPPEPRREPPLAGTPVATPLPGEVGGPKGPEPTRYGDWENKGRATDF